MKIDKIINGSAKDHSPYAGDLINHLPMAQWSIYKMAGDEGKVYEFTKKYLKNNNITKLEGKNGDISSLDETLGNKELYEEVLSFLEKESLNKGVEELTSYILNKYRFGISSGLFHTIIRLGYALEAYKEEPALEEEVLRSLAYYITAYRESKLFKRYIDPENIRQEMENLAKNKGTKQILQENDSLGQRIKNLYKDNNFLENGFIIKGSKNKKLKTLLEMLVPLFYKHSNIVVLHCITAINAIIKLEEYYEDYEETVDILTTSIITHLITTGIEEYPGEILSKTGFSWKCLKEKASKSKDVHDIKFTYSCFRIDEIFDMELLKDISLRRIKRA